MANWIDVIAVIAIAFFVYNSSTRGVMRALLDVFVVLFSVFFAGMAFKFLAGTIMPFLRSTDRVVYAIIFLVFWIIAYVILDLIAGSLHKVMKVTFMNPVESLGGAVLGLIRGILIVGLIIQLLMILPIASNYKNLINMSLAKRLSLPTLRRSYSSVFGMFPQIDLFIQEKVVPAVPTKDKAPSPNL
ncbi:CvpA family protein [Candidatus Margulisiibacteriota bacterium]